jgi:mRNA deadenylase 3'-5' endonuclease subunit Ccr4
MLFEDMLNQKPIVNFMSYFKYFKPNLDKKCHKEYFLRKDPKARYNYKHNDFMINQKTKLDQ